MAERDLVVRLIGDDASLRRAFTRSSTGTKQFSRDVSAATRGAAAGSGAFRSLGRSIVFASGGFLAFTSGAAFLRKTVDAAKEAQVANAQLATQLANSGKSFAVYRQQIDSTISRLSALAGIEDDELKQGLTTILRTVPDVSKALRDLSTAADLARARHISLAQAAIIIAKTEAGNTTLLRRQGFQIAKNATAEQALAKVRAVVAGQAAAGTTAQERFGAVLHQTEEIIGQGILPTLNKYLDSGSKWLQQMNESGRLQKDVASAAHDFDAAMSAVKDTVKVVDKFTGSFKNTLEILIGLKIARWAIGVGRDFSFVGTQATIATGKVAGLQARLAGLSAAKLLAPVAIGITAQEIADRLGENTDFSPGAFLKSVKHPFKNAKGPLLNWLLGNGWQSDLERSGKQAADEATKQLAATRDKFAKQVADFLAKTPGSFGTVPEQLGPPIPGTTGAAGGVGGGRGGGLSASQRNTFFDNMIARILLRGGLGDVQQQITALQKADELIKKRLSVTKDVTRRLNLEDELLQNQAQIKSLQGQAAAEALAKRELARQAVLDALQKRAEARSRALSALTSKQFRELGLSATGDEITPGVAALKRRLGQLTANVDASSLNTPKLQTQLARFRKVLSEGLVPRDVRAKIKELMDQIAADLKNAPKHLAKFRHTNANALLAGLGLDAETTRILRQRLAQVGVGGTVPGVRSPSFAGAGAGQTTVILKADGRELARVVATHQRRQNQRRSESRRGPYAGRN